MTRRIPPSALAATLALAAAIVLLAFLLSGPGPFNQEKALTTTPFPPTGQASPPPLDNDTGRDVDAEETPTTTNTPSGGGLGGITGGLVVRGAKLVQPWIQAVYFPVEEGYGVKLLVSFDRVMPLTPGFAGSLSIPGDLHGEKGPWSPLGFWDGERSVLYVMEYPLWYARAFLEGRLDELDRMFQALVPPDGLGVVDARLLPPSLWGADNAPGLVALLEDGRLVLLPPPSSGEDVVASGKSGIVRVVFLQEPRVLAEGVEGLGAVGVAEAGSELFLIIPWWRGGKVFFSLYKTVGGGEGSLEQEGLVRLVVEKPVVWAGLVGEGRAAVVAGGKVYLITIGVQAEKPPRPLELPGGVRAGVPVGDEGLLLLDGEGGLWLVGGSGGAKKLLEQTRGPGFVVDYREPYLGIAHREGMVFYEWTLGSTSVREAASLGFEVPEDCWGSMAVLEGLEGLSENIARAHGVSVGGDAVLYGLVCAGEGEAWVTVVAGPPPG